MVQSDLKPLLVASQVSSAELPTDVTNTRFYESSDIRLILETRNLLDIELV